MHRSVILKVRLSLLLMSKLLFQVKMARVRGTYLPLNVSVLLDIMFLDNKLIQLMFVRISG